MRQLRIIAYDRPVYLLQTLDALRRVRGLDTFEIVGSVDALPQGGHNPRVVELLHGITDDVRLRDRFDCGDHVKLNWEEAVNETDACLFVEDDIVLAPDAIEWIDRSSASDKVKVLGLFATAVVENAIVAPDSFVFEPSFNAWGYYVVAEHLCFLLKAMDGVDWNGDVAWDTKLQGIFRGDPKGPRGRLMYQLNPVLSRSRNIGAYGRYSTGPEDLAKIARPVWSGDLEQ